MARRMWVALGVAVIALLACVPGAHAAQLHPTVSDSIAFTVRH